MNSPRKGAVNTVLMIAVVVIALVAGYFAFKNSSTDVDDRVAIEQLVKSFGEKLNNVDKLRPNEEVKNAIQESYSNFISPELLDQWLSNPQDVPGRTVSSPSPNRIEIESVSEVSDSEYSVKGFLIWWTSTGESKQPADLSVIKQDDKWVINDFSLSGDQVASDQFASHIILSATTPLEKSQIEIGSTRNIFWDYSGVLKNKIQSSKSTLVILVDVESVEKLGNPIGRGGFLIGNYFNSFDTGRLKIGAYAGKVMKVDEILKTTSYNWKIQDFVYSCPPGGFCQGPNAEKNYEERAKLVPGKYTIEVCVYDGMDKYCSNKVTVELINPDETANWQTYRNEKYEFEIKYPKELKTYTHIVDKPSYNEGTKIVSQGEENKPEFWISISLFANRESYGLKEYKAKEKIIMAAEELYIDYLKDESQTLNNIPNTWHRAEVNLRQGDILISFRLDKIPDNDSENYDLLFKKIIKTFNFTQ